MGVNSNRLNFVLIGAAGYIAPRHMKAIKDTGHNLIAAIDPSDSVGIIDRFFPDAFYFSEWERLDRFIEKKKQDGITIDYFVVCSPNYLHDAHVRFGLKHGADIICEKPLVLNPWNLDSLEKIEKDTGNNVYNILQLRLHDSIIELYDTIKNSRNKSYDVNLNYHTPRGHWYHASWKGDVSKSGGVITNIGIHFFDVLIWIFGKVVEFKLEYYNYNSIRGYTTLEFAKVNWNLSIERNELMSARRILQIDDQIVDFSKGFEDLHTLSYQRIFNGQGYGISDVRPAIQLVSDIRAAAQSLEDYDNHPFN